VNANENYLLPFKILVFALKLPGKDFRSRLGGNFITVVFTSAGDLSLSGTRFHGRSDVSS
jgi:hypothetical protein